MQKKHYEEPIVEIERFTIKADIATLSDGNTDETPDTEIEF